MKNRHRRHKSDDFIAPARRALRRVACQIRIDHVKFGLPLVFGDKGKVRLIRVR
jgi:hypothetical protein